jgi:hypothetical protein
VECRSDRTDLSVALDSLADPGWSREMDSVGKTVFKPSSHALVSICVVLYLMPVIRIDVLIHSFAPL